MEQLLNVMRNINLQQMQFIDTKGVVDNRKVTEFILERIEGLTKSVKVEQDTNISVTIQTFDDTGSE